MIEYPLLIIGTISFFHNYYYNLFKKEIKDFNTFTIYYNFTNLKKEQIDIWKYILLTIRLFLYFLFNSFKVTRKLFLLL